MEANETQPDANDMRPFANPWPALIAGTAGILAALVINVVTAGSLGWLVFGLIAVSVLAGGAAVTMQPKSAVVLAPAAVIALLASLIGDRTEWDSARMVLRILGVLGGFGAVVVMCPAGIQRLLVSLFLIFHFGGIFTAVASASQGWVPNQLWVYVYRPYLLFLYLNNAYHFYSPEPGPSPLLWFCIEYENDPDGSRNLRWVKIPSMDQDGKPRDPDDRLIWPNVEYTRRLSMAESTNYPGSPPLNFFDLAKERVSEGELRGIPIAQDMSIETQYREPNDIGKRWIQVYVRHVASTYHHQSKPNLKVTGVKVYRVIHRIILPGQIVEGMKPDDKTLYSPFYMGEFDANGDMKPTGHTVQIVTMTGEVVKIDRDPFLYWLIPIMRPIKDLKPFNVKLQEKVKNYVLVHAGDVDEGDLP
jgi:hypothetical protein